MQQWVVVVDPVEDEVAVVYLVNPPPRPAAGTPVRVAESLDAIPELVAAEARAGDVVVTLGAGSIAAVPERIVAALRRKTGGSP